MSGLAVILYAYLLVRVGGAVAQVVECVTPGEEVLGSISALAASWICLNLWFINHHHHVPGLLQTSAIMPFQFSLSSVRLMRSLLEILFCVICALSPSVFWYHKPFRWLARQRNHNNSLRPFVQEGAHTKHSFR